MAWAGAVVADFIAAFPVAIYSGFPQEALLARAGTSVTMFVAGVLLAVGGSNSFLIWRDVVPQLLEKLERQPVSAQAAKELGNREKAARTQHTTPHEM